MANVILLFSTVTQWYKYFLAVIASRRIHPLHSNNTEKAEANESQVPDLWSQAETLVRAYPNVKEINLCPIHRKGRQKEESRMGSHYHWPLFDSQSLCNKPNTCWLSRRIPPQFAHCSTAAKGRQQPQQHPSMQGRPAEFRFPPRSVWRRIKQIQNVFFFFLQPQGRVEVEAGQGTAVPKWPQWPWGDKPAEDKGAATSALTQQADGTGWGRQEWNAGWACCRQHHPQAADFSIPR